jgi:hypothetical protein
MRIRPGRVIAATITVSAAAALAATPAFADNPPGGIVWDHTYKEPGVTVYVEEHGDIISVCDSSENGHSAWVEVNYAYGRYRLTASGGVGTCATGSASDGWDLPEELEISLLFDGNGGSYAEGVESFVNDH